MRYIVLVKACHILIPDLSHTGYQLLMQVWVNINYQVWNYLKIEIVGYFLHSHCANSKNKKMVKINEIACNVEWYVLKLDILHNVQFTKYSPWHQIGVWLDTSSESHVLLWVRGRKSRALHYILKSWLLRVANTGLCCLSTLIVYFYSRRFY